MKKLSHLIDSLPALEEQTKKEMEMIRKEPDINDLLQHNNVSSS